MLLIFAQVGWACQVRERRTYSSRACGKTQGNNGRKESGETEERERLCKDKSDPTGISERKSTTGRPSRRPPRHCVARVAGPSSCSL